MAEDTRRKSREEWHIGVCAARRSGDGTSLQKFMLVVSPELPLRELARRAAERFERSCRGQDLPVHLFRHCHTGYDLDLDFCIGEVLQNGDELYALRLNEVHASWTYKQANVVTTKTQVAAVPKPDPLPQGVKRRIVRAKARPIKQVKNSAEIHADQTPSGQKRRIDDYEFSPADAIREQVVLQQEIEQELRKTPAKLGHKDEEGQQLISVGRRNQMTTSPSPYRSPRRDPRYPVPLRLRPRLNVIT